MNKLFFLGLAVGLVSLTACKKKGCTDPAALNYSSEAEKDDESCTYAPAVPTENVTLHMDHKWGAADFDLNAAYTHPTTGDELTFTTLKYYVSNIKLKKDDGTWWVQPESYYLLDLSQGEMLTIADVPEGNYTDISYTMGVDSTRNVSGAQTGALSTAYGMFWSWNSGYIMTKAEGTSPQSGTGSFTFHLGGFSGVNNTAAVKEASFGGTLTLNGTGSPKVHMTVDPSAFFTTIGSVSGTSMVHMPGANAATMSTDFHSGVNFLMIHN